MALATTREKWKLSAPFLEAERQACSRHASRNELGGEDALRQGVAVEGGRVLAAHLAQLDVGEVAPVPLDDGLRVGPGAVAVRVVDLHHDVVDADRGAGGGGRRD